MNKILTAFVLCFMFVGINQIAAQPSIFLDPNFALVNEGDNVSIDITTNDFTAIQVIRFTLEYEDGVMTYDSANFNPTLNAAGSGCSVTSNMSDPARLTVECILDVDCTQAPATDVTLPDGELIVTLNFTALNGYTDISIIDDINDADDHYVQRICNDIGLIIDDPAKVAVDNLPVTINIPDVNANTGEQICLDFSLLDFEDIISMQYSISWDPLVLDYVQVDGYNLPGISSDNFNYLPGDDVLIFTWNEPSTNGASVTDGTNFTQICFDVVGDCGDVSTIQIESLPTPVEITNVDDPGQDIGFFNGLGTVTINCNNPDGLGIALNAPSSCVNPGESFSICAEVSNFVNLEEVAFTLNWNSSAISATSIDPSTSGLAGFGLAQLDQSLINQGLLGVSWTDPTCSGANLADGVDLFCIDFTSVGSGGVNSSIYLSSDLDPINITTQCNGSDDLGVNASNGLVEICIPTGITISAGDFDVDPGDQICVPIEVQDFSDVESFAFSIAWDNSVLSYVSNQNSAIGGIVFDEAFEDFGSLCATWNGGGTAETLNDGTTLFDVCFEAIGAPFSCSVITFPQFPCEQDVLTSESAGFSVDVNAQDGEVCMVNPAALNIDISNANGLPGDVVCVDFTVSNFVSLSDVSFSIEWDNTVLDYVELQNPGNLPNFTTDSYTDNNSSIGVVGIDWQTLSVFGNSLSNGSEIFSICFNPIGGSGDCADITITSTFNDIEVLSAFGADENLGLEFNDGEICVEQFVTILDSFITPASCEGIADASVNITASGGSGSFNFFWYNSNGDLISTDLILSNVLSGDYVLVIQDANNSNLESSFELTIGLDNSAPVADAGDDFCMPCDSVFGIMDGSGSSTGSDFSYEWTDLGSTNNIFPTDILNPQVGGAGNFMLAVTDNTTGCTVTDTISVCPKVLPAAVLSFASQDTILNCLVDTVQISTETSSNFDNPNIQYTWTTNLGQIDPGTENDQSISVLVPGTYVLEVSNAQSDCSSFDSIVVAQDILLPSAVAGDDFVLNCDTTAIELDGSNSDLGALIEYEWSYEDGTIISNNVISSQVSSIGDYILTVTNGANGCAGTDTINLSSDQNLPIVTLGSNLQLDCDNPTVTIDATGSSVGAEFVYTWFQNGIDLMDSNPSIEVSQADTYELEILNTDNSCLQMSAIIVSDSTALPQIPQLTSGIISCDIASTIITNDLSGVDHYSFEWAGPGVDPLAINDAEPTVTSSGDYTITVSNTNTGCQESEIISIAADTLVSSLNALSIIDGNPDAVLTCDDQTITLQLGLDAATDFQIVWAGPSISVVDELEPLISGPGTVFVFYENIQNGCVDTLSFTSTEDQVDPIVNGITSNIVEWGCSDTEATLEVITDISTVGDYEYNWAAIGCNDVTVINNGNTSTVTGPCDFEVLIANPDNGCVISESIIIEDIRSTPDVDAGAEVVNLNCDPSTVILTGSSSTPGVVFEWSFNSGVVGDASNFEASAIGVYTLTVTDPTNDCTSNAETTVETAILPTVSAGSNVEFGCLDNTTQLNGSSTDDVTYLWTGNCVDTPNIAAATVSCPGIYTLEVVDNSTGCISLDSTEVILVYDVDFAEASLTSDPCVTEEVQFDGNIPATGVTGLWTINPISAVIDNPAEQSVVLFDLEPGTYTATWTLSTDNCPEYSSSDVTFDVLSAPVANDDEIVIDDNNSFGQVDLLDNDVLTSGYNYSVTVNGTPGVGNFIVSDSEVEYTPTALLFDGNFDLTYEVCVEGCENLCAEGLLNILINRSIDADADFPNTITPNGDGLNDEFRFDILSSSPEKYPDNNMIIFNRWGDVVFQAAPYTNNWSGQNEGGQDLPEGTYYYVLELDVANGIILNGSITVLR